MTEKEITDELFRMQDKKYRSFQAKLIPNVTEDNVIGVRTPLLRDFAKRLYKESSLSEGAPSLNSFFSRLPHKFFDESQLHAFIISEQKDFAKCMSLLEAFLPYVDNWATCDQLSPRIFKKHHSELLPYIKNWLNSTHTYTVRFAIGMLMQHFLEDDFDTAYPETVAAIRSDEYYINMMIAWYFATALAKQQEKILPFFEQKKLAPWTHNKAIQKSVESYRITPELKEYLKTLKV